MRGFVDGLREGLTSYTARYRLGCWKPTLDNLITLPTRFLGDSQRGRWSEDALLR